MKSLKWLREQGKLMNEADILDTRKLSITEKAKIFRMLYRTALPMLEATEHLYRPAREKYLRELQSRLYRIKKWEQHRERPLQKRSKTSKKTR